MISKPIVALLGVASCVAAASGAYLAVRQNQAPIGLSALPPETTAPALASDAAAPAGPAVAAASPTTDTTVAVDEADAKPTSTEAEKSEPAKEPDAPKAIPRRTIAPRAERRSPAPAPQASRVPDQPAVASEPPPPPAPLPSVAEPVRDGDPMAAERPVDRTPQRPERAFEQLVVSADSVIGLQMETTLTSERAQVEDRTEARVTRDVTVGDRTAIPAGSRMIGSVTLVDKGGKVRERSRLGVRFHTLVLADGTTLPVQTETIFREGESPARESAAKIGGAAVGGAILGAIFGGAKGAVIGGSTGAAGGTAVVMAGDRNPAVLNAGTSVTVRLSSPLTVTVERN
jgi:hypothetical protein